MISHGSAFRTRLGRALVLSSAINLAWLVCRTRIRQRPLLDLPASEPDGDRPTPVWIMPATYVVASTADAVGWATLRPLLPTQPELARAIYQYVPGLIYIAGVREVSGLLDSPKPTWRRQLRIPRGENALRIGVSILCMGPSNGRCGTRPRRAETRDRGNA
jgi:hypothetical protein